ncbi:MAG: glycosyltransferase family 39 protein [Bacteroidales bacterium]|nr:glycosyltransferase family 39 protein [Bacteroidales bacterium]
MRNIFDKNHVLLLLLGALLFIPFNGGVHLFDWDEINFAESAREMIVTGNYLDVQINYEIFWEKPPLFIWMQVASMKIFGINEFAARFPNAICGIVTMLLLYAAGKRLQNSKFGLFWSLTYITSLLPFFYFKSGIIDPWFNAFIFLSVWYIILYSGKFKGNKLYFSFISALFLGLAILTKGPVALLVFALVYLIQLIYFRFKTFFRIKDLLVFILTLVFIGGFWFILQIISGNIGAVQDFINYQIRLFSTQDAGHGGFLFYHFVVLFFGVFPASVIALRAFIKKKDTPDAVRYVKTWMIVLFLVVLILFTIVKTKIIHYSSLCYFPLSFLAAMQLYRIAADKDKIRLFEKILLIFMGCIYAIGLAAFSNIEIIKTYLFKNHLIQDPFAIANLQADAHWNGFEWLISLILLMGLVYFIANIGKQNKLKTLIVFGATLLVFHMGAMVLFVPRAEEYTQKAAIEYFKELPEDECYVKTLGYKSYADLFYFNKPVPINKLSSDAVWLLYGNIDKPVYFISKCTRKEQILNENRHLQVIGEKNGFVFYKREL